MQSEDMHVVQLLSGLPSFLKQHAKGRPQFFEVGGRLPEIHLSECTAIVFVSQVQSNPGAVECIILQGFDEAFGITDEPCLGAHLIAACLPDASAPADCLVIGALCLKRLERYAIDLPPEIFSFLRENFPEE